MFFDENRHFSHCQKQTTNENFGVQIWAAPKFGSKKGRCLEPLPPPHFEYGGPTPPGGLFGSGRNPYPTPIPLPIGHRRVQKAIGGPK